jgi:predicted ATPase/class 3 adenylate cyclase
LKGGRVTVAFVAALSVRALLFTDMEGSTRLLQRLGGRFEALLERHHEIIGAAVLGWSGLEQSREGDGLFATFPSATSALEAALEAQRRLETEPWPPDGRVRVRMGLHMGEVAETRAGLVGLAIHLAARIGAAAHGGQIVASGDIVTHAASLPSGAGWRTLGVHDLRDVGRVVIHQLEHPDLQREFPPLRTRRAVAHHVPVPLNVLIGRDAEARAVSALVDQHRLVTLVGEGGCGKTRLALRAASSALDRFGHGVWFVDLTQVAPGADVTSRVAQVLGTPDGLDELISALAEQDVLLVLDNCEHVLGSTTNALARLLTECPTVRVLATSRTSLGLPGEALFRVPPLALPRSGASLREALDSEAVQLFAARAALVRPGYTPTNRDAGAVVEVCTRLEGLPLAIELAAARLRATSVHELRRDLDDRFGVLVGGSPFVPERHRTLHAAVQWSFQLLDFAEQHVLCQLAAFRGGTDLDGARAVCSSDAVPSGHVLDILIRLVDKSLVAAVEDDNQMRYRLHETIRDYALESLSDRDADRLHERHARWFAALASRLAGGPEPGGEREWIRHHDIEVDNLRAAAEWLVVRDPPSALRLGLDIAQGTSLTPQTHWYVDVVHRALPLAAGAPTATRADALGVLAWDAIANFSADAVRLVAEAVEVLRDVDDPVAHVSVLVAVARFHAQEPDGQLDSRDVSAAVRAGDRMGGTYWPFMVRYALSYRAHPSLVALLNVEALQIAESHGFELFACLARANLAIAAQFRGDSAQALATSRQLVPLLDDLLTRIAEPLDVCSLIEGEHGDLGVGIRLGEHLLLRLTAGPHDPSVAAAMYATVAHLRRLAGDLTGSEAAVEHAIRGFSGRTTSFVGNLAVITRSALWRARGRPDQAAFVMRHTCDLGWFHGSSDIEMRVLEELAAVAVALDRYQDGVDLLATAQHARHRDGKPLSPACRPEVAKLQAQLGEHRGTTLPQSNVRALAHSIAIAD